MEKEKEMTKFQTSQAIKMLFEMLEPQYKEYEAVKANIDLFNQHGREVDNG